MYTKSLRDIVIELNKVGVLYRANNSQIYLPKINPNIDNDKKLCDEINRFIIFLKKSRLMK